MRAKHDAMEAEGKLQAVENLSEYQLTYIYLLGVSDLKHSGK